MSALAWASSHFIADPRIRRSAISFGSDQSTFNANVYVVAGCVGVRADLVCKIDHLPRQRLIDIWKMNPKFSGDSEPTFRACSDCDRSCDSSIRRSKTRTGADGCQFATRAEGFESLRVSRIPPMRK